MKTRFVSLALCAAFLLTPLFASCSESGQEEGQDPQSAQEQTAADPNAVSDAAETAEVYNWGGLPDQVSSVLRNGGNIASTLAKLDKMVTKGIEKSISSFEENNKW